ncbi:hypothetical protein Tco_1002709 [Tanacetum coccineum]|uniref:Uncharacterized protein n=1 Tax=Tanacetum coccineum TaxID=301880 RepID=A0ABQ5F702_9ASTR
MKMQEVILFYNGLGIPTRQILDSKCAIPSKTVGDAKVAIQEMVEYSQKWHNGTSRSRSTETSCRINSYTSTTHNHGERSWKVNEKSCCSSWMRTVPKDPNPQLHQRFPLKEEGKTLEEAYYTQFGRPFQGGERRFGSLPSSTETNLRDQVKSISTTIEADVSLIRRIGFSQYVVSTGQNRTFMYETRQATIMFPSRLNGYYYEEKKGSYGPQFSKAHSEASQSIPQKEKDPGSFTLPCFLNNVCFDNALVDLKDLALVLYPLCDLNLNLGLGRISFTQVDRLN